MIRLLRGESESGVAVLEMAVITPLLLMLILAGLEYSRALERIQWASQLSRELTSLAYRKCSASEAEEIDRCLQEYVVDQLKTTASTLSPNTEFVVAVYRYDAALAEPVIRDSIIGTSSFKTRFDNLGFSVATLKADAAANKLGSAGYSLKRNRVLVVGTVFIPMGLTIAKAIPGRFNSIDQIYATTVI